MARLIEYLLRPNVLLGTAVVLAIWIIGNIVYRRYFHPLAKIPGPFWPAVSTLPQSFYNGLYYRKIEEYHRKYGPIIRVQTNEVHLADQADFDSIYHVGSKYTKASDYYWSICIPNATHTTLSNELHRKKRARLNPMFSRKMVLELEEVVQSKAHKVLEITRNALDENKPADLHHAFRAVSVDVISEYAFDKSYDLLERPDLGAYFFQMTRGLGPAMYAFQQSFLLRDFALAIPPSIAIHLGGAMKQVTSLQQEGIRQLRSVKARMDAGELSTKRPTIFSELLDPEKQEEGYTVPPMHKLKDDVYSILAAAADTTGNTMTVATYHVLKNPEMYATLRKELLIAFPDADAHLDFVTLEKLPYLSAVIQEALRLAFGVPGRLPRVVPQGGATFQGYFLPEGTIVSMSAWIMQRNPEIFKEPMKFDPSRWLDPVEYRKLDQHMMPFGGGSRICVGMPLAFCELYVTLGYLFHRFDNLKVHLTTDYDMEFEDFFSSYPIQGRNWLKAVRKD